MKRDCKGKASGACRRRGRKFIRRKACDEGFAALLHPQFQELPADPLSEKLRGSQREVSPHPSQPLAGAGELFHTACDTHTDKGICCSEPAPPASPMLAAVQTRARKAGRVRSGRRVSGMVLLLPHSRASEAAVRWTPAGSEGWRGCGKRKGRKRGESRPGGAVTAPSFPGSEGRRLGGPENFGALGGRPAAALRLAPRPPLGPQLRSRWKRS